MSDVTTDQQKYDNGYKAGVNAAKIGQTEADNPYYEMTPEWQGWLKGVQDEQAGCAQIT